MRATVAQMAPGSSLPDIIDRAPHRVEAAIRADRPAPARQVRAGTAVTAHRRLPL
ncbi:hypothetical protein [Gluconacetobacter tumulisoli]|uniref:Uncharacterized protein n=1 Tax=Gluconacetobacter tumulisoli TaxID=1286189 RepID=A0A7W4PQX6_9PROT|nr:hypothetical protein [Gluconacetobacter tumulisoli]MBB2203246.1 hypothetical protein [Gluconacetobacter tumulisoli]